MIEAKQTVKLAICLMLAIGMSVGMFNVVGTDGARAAFAQTEITAPTISSIAVTSDPDGDDEAYFHENINNVPYALYDLGVYGIGDTIEVTVTFSESVTVTGSPQLQLDVGSSSKVAAYSSTDGSKVAFTYTVAVGDSDTDGISIGANKLSLNGGSIKEAMDNHADLSHSTLSPQSRHQVDGVRPTISSIGLYGGNTFYLDGIYTIGDFVHASVTFSEDVTVMGVNSEGRYRMGDLKLALNVGGTTRLANWQPLPINKWIDDRFLFLYTVVNGDLDLNGASIAANSLRLNQAGLLSQTTLKDGAGNDAVLTHGAVADSSGGKVDGVPPTISSISITSNPGSDDTYGVGDRIEVTVTFSETVAIPRWNCSVDGQPAICMPRIELNIGGVTKLARTPETSRITSTSVVFRYTVRAGDNDADGISIGANAITDDGSVTDNNGNDGGHGGNDADLTHAALADDSGHKVATSAPPKSTDATLSSLTLSDVNFGTFASATTSYTAQVANSVLQTTVTPTVNHSGANYVIKLGGVEDSDGTISLAVDSNVITVEVTAEDDSTTKTYTLTVTRAAPLPTDATLSALTLSDVNFGTFASGATSYTAQVANSVAQTTVAPTVNDSDASYVIKLGGVADSDGVIPLSVGGNVITIEVTAEDTTTTQTYTVTVTRSASTDATLSGLTLSDVNFGAFVSRNTAYTVEVANSVTETTVTPTVNHSGASYVIKLGGVTDADGVIPLAPGSNVITIEVTAANDTTIQTYTVTVTRLVSIRQTSTDATLSALSLSGVNFGTFASGTESYTASVASSVTETTVTPTVNDSDATYVIKLGGVTDADGTVSLAVGSNVITVEVTAEDEQTTKTYTVTVTRAAPLTDATLEWLALSGIDIGNGLGHREYPQTQTSFTASVYNNVSQTTVTATPSHAAASYVVKLSGVTDADGTVSLAVGNNVITVEVTAENGQTTKSYTATVARASASAPTTGELSTDDPRVNFRTISYTHSYVALTLSYPRNRAITGVVTQRYKHDGDSFVSAGSDGRYENTFDDDLGGLKLSWTYTEPEPDTLYKWVAKMLNTQSATVIETSLTVRTPPEPGTTTLSSDATLSDLTLSNVDFEARDRTFVGPGFHDTVTSYVGSAANSVTETTVTPTANDSGASYVIKLGGVTDSDGTVSLAVGSNVITVEVTAEDEETTRTYTVTVTRTALSTDATLSGLTMSSIDFGTFASGTTSYSASVSNGVTQTTVSPTVNDSGASYVIKLDGVTDADGTVSLTVGSNVITVEVTAQDGSTKRTYSVTVTRAAPVSDQGSTPDTPDQPNGTAVFVGGVDLEWNDVPGADSYDVQLFRNGQWMDLPGDGVEIASYGAGAIISELDPGSSSWFQVRAGNAHGSSDWSDFRQVGSTNQTTLGKRARPDNVTASGAPVINGTVQVGESLTADTAGIEDGNGLDRVQFRFQWVSNDGSADTDIASATDSTYTLAPNDEGKTIKVRVSFTDRGGYAESLTGVGTELVTSSAQANPAPTPEPAQNSPATGAPTISGTPQVGQTLTADTSGISDSDGLTNVTYGYQWVANDGTSDTDIAGATDSTYILVAADEGRTIKVQVSFTDDAANAESLTSAATATVDPAPNSPATGAPTISGTAQVGEILTADTSGIADTDGLANVSYSYQWIANDGTSDTAISGATNSTYTLVAADEGKTVKVRVSFTDDAGNDETLTSGATATVDPAPNSPATGAPAISGTAQVGETLTAATSGIADADGLANVSYSYQWVTNDGTSDTDIAGATGSSYTLVTGDQGKTIRVRVSFTDDAGNHETLTGAATAAVDAAPNSPATGAPAISGAAQVGQTLTADTSGIADTDGLTNVAYGYQWIRNDGGTDTDISGATDSGYTLVADDEGRTIKVKVSFTDDAGHGETLTSAATAAVDATPNNQATGAPTITGAAQVGQTLTADTSAIADADGLDTATFTYQWVANDGTSDTDIAGATGSTYTLVDADQGGTIKVRVSFTDDPGNDETLTSAATAAVDAPPNSPATGAPAISGTAQVGQTLTADTSGIADADGLTNVSYSYQWIRNDGSSDIAGATDSTYALVDADEGKTIKVKVGFTDDAGSDESLASAATGSVAAHPDQGSAPGTPDQPVGTAVFVGGVDLEWNDVPGADSYDVQLFRNGQWMDLPGDGVEIASYGAGAIISELDPGSSSWFQVRAGNAHGSSDWSNFRQVGSTNQSALGKLARPDNAPASGAPVIDGTAQVGESLTADTTGIEDGNGLDRVQFRLQWVFNNGSADAEITGATGSSYTLVAADEGKTVKVRVSFTDRGGYAESLTSAATDTVSFAVQQQVANNPATGAPAVNGNAQVGETLTADTSGIADADGLTNVSYSYQWIANDGTNDTDITGATDSGYILAAADEGRTIKVKVSFTDDAGHGETLTSAATAAVDAASNSPATGAPTITGTAQVGETLTAATSGIADADGLTNVSYSYQWIANDGTSDTAISGATNSTYTLVNADEGGTIKVRVSFTDDAGNDETLTSGATGIVAAALLPLTVSLENNPATHNGTDVFTFEIRFSEEFPLSFRTLKVHALQVTGGTVKKARRVDNSSDIHWRITVRPDADGNVSIVLPVTDDCDDQGAICTRDGRKLSNGLEFTVVGPGG